ncbi:MAG TPA: Tm-1-like ATP-binding domain-containing protein [Gemmataceae bacterium]|jgi:uncharacterized protein (UPF0261 family)|nr:Tm-1-like ATP-binding domain-containing protein [Gemmataceae bacterium]
MPSVYVIATLDTKGREAAFVAERVRAAGASAITVDVGVKEAPVAPPDLSREHIADCHPRGPAAVLGHADRGQAVTAMSEALVEFLTRENLAGKVAGVIGLGGSGGTALIAPAMRALPIGLPKLLVSTVASGNTAQYVGCCDIVLMPSVVDVAGLNVVSREVLANAAHAVAGMVLHRAGERRGSSPPSSTVGLTMFGVTTPCVTAVRELLEAEGHDVLTFHATGTGGQAMEKLVESGLIGGALDITTTEVADEVVGGVFPAGPARFDAILAKRVPYVVSLGALDMVNFGPRETVPPQFRDRKLHVHNAQVTLMRTTPDENRRFARWIAEKLNRSTAPLVLLIPEHGVSAIDAPGQPFHDPEADRALFDELETAIEQTPTRQVRRLPYHINDPVFAAALVAAFNKLPAPG